MGAGKRVDVNQFAAEKRGVREFETLHVSGGKMKTTGINVSLRRGCEGLSHARRYDGAKNSKLGRIFRPWNCSSVRHALKLTVALAPLLASVSSGSFAQSVPNVQQPAPGTLLSGPVDPQMGRLAVIQYLGGYVITIPEGPGSDSGDHMAVKAWDFSNPGNPVEVMPVNPDPATGSFGVTNHPFMAHGSISRDNEVFINGWPNDAIRVDENGNLEHASWSGPDAPFLVDRNGRDLGVQANWWVKSGMMRPWAMDDNWEYNSDSTVSRLSLGNRLLAEWDITQETGVAGFANFMGNLMVYASDQRNSGVATYDVSDIYYHSASGTWRPRLLDTLNLPIQEGGIGGYWSEISGHYMVFARRDSFAGVQVVDFSDPRDLRLHCNIRVDEPLGQFHWTLDPSPMYVGFQDNYVFSDKYKINIETCEIEVTLDITQGEVGNLCYQGGSCPARSIDTSQYSRIIGNLWITGGVASVANTDGMGVWAHQSEPDTTPPSVAFHIPRPNETNYPLDVPLGFSIPETIRPQTIVVTETAQPSEPESLTLTEVGGGAVPIDYVLSHTGILTVEPLELLKPDTSYEVSFSSDILDAAGNGMEPYSFRFSTGDTVSGSGGGTGSGSVAVIESISLYPDGPVQVSETVTVSVLSSNASEYEISLDGDEAIWQPFPSRSFIFDQPGDYSVNVRARNSNGVSSLQRLQVNVEGSEILQMGTNSSQLYCDESEGMIWSVNPDNDSITKIDLQSMQRVFEVDGPDSPQSIALSSREDIWVTSSGEDLIYIFDKNGALVQTIGTGYGSQPMHVVGSIDGSQMYVSLYGSGEVLSFRSDDPAETPRRLEVGPTPKAIAVSPDGRRLLVTRYISAENWGEIYQIDTERWVVTETYELYKHLVDDQLDEGRGVPNYVSGVAITPDGRYAFVTAKKDNVDRGLINGHSQDLDPDNTVRTMMMVLDLNAGTELRDRRIDFDNAESPSAVTIGPDGNHVFVTLQGKNTVVALDLDGGFQLTGAQTNIYTGLAPQGMCVDHGQNMLSVKNYTERTVSVIDLGNGVNGPRRRCHFYC